MRSQHGALGRLRGGGADRAGVSRAAVGGGLQQIGIEPTRVYEFEDAKAFLAEAGLDSEVVAREVGGRVMGAFIRATSPPARGSMVEAAVDDYVRKAGDEDVLGLLTRPGSPPGSRTGCQFPGCGARGSDRRRRRPGVVRPSRCCGRWVDPTGRGSGLGQQLVERPSTKPTWHP